MLSRSVMTKSLGRHRLQPARLLCPWDSPDKNTGVGCHTLLQEIFPTQRSNPGLPHCRHILYQLSHQGSPRILEWVAYPFPSGTSQPRDQTQVSRITCRFFTSSATREAHIVIGGEEIQIQTQTLELLLLTTQLDKDGAYSHGLQLVFVGGW